MDAENRVALRFIQKKLASGDMTPQIRGILMVARRGSMPQVPYGNILEALKFLNWTVEDTEVPMRVENQAFVQVYEPDLPKAQAMYEELKREEVHTLPTSAPIGTTFVMDVAKPKPQQFMGGGSGYTIMYKQWRMVPAKRITDLKSKQFLSLPDAWDAKNWKPGEKLRPKLDPLLKWLKTESSIKEDATKALGLDEYVPGAKVVPQSQHGSGTCPACFGFYKLRPGSTDKIVVLHGYQRPGWGYTVGKCPGAGWPPYELSASGTVDFKKYLERSLEREKRELSQLENGTTKSLLRRDWKLNKKMVTVVPGEPEWARTLESSIHEHQQTIRSLTGDIQFLEKMIDTWVLRPLTETGKIRPQWKE